MTPAAGTGLALLAICACVVPCAAEVLPLSLLAISFARIEVIEPISLRSVVKWFRALASVMSMFASRHAPMNSLIAQSSWYCDVSVAVIMLLTFLYSYSILRFSSRLWSGSFLICMAR